MTTQIRPGEPGLPQESQVGEWRDKKRYLWLMGLIAPTALIVMLPNIWLMNQAGWQTASQTLLWVGRGLTPWVGHGICG